MILLVPISPEVPKEHTPVLWPALLLLLLLGVGFLLGYERIIADFEYVSSLKSYLTPNADGRAELTEEAHTFLKKRPLLAYAPAKGDWDIARLIYANFLHGSIPHLVLNWVGVFAGARICTTFIPFLCTLSIFILGGSLGLLVSMWLSTEASAFIPHIGASGGIFALMGTYYVYNFRFRTKYFFWFPSRHGSIKLKTSWFFFVDVILLEVILSTGQFLPDRVDSVDHLAHVVGFGSGVILALGLRYFQGWPGFLQTRAEFHRWANRKKEFSIDLLNAAFENWCELLTINPYNDQLKIHLCRILKRHPNRWSPEQLQTAFSFFSPTFVRLFPEETGAAIGALLQNKIAVPPVWLSSTPYDSIIRLAQELARDPDTQPFLFDFVSLYRRAHPEGANTERKLELLMAKLRSLQPPSETAMRSRQT
jgi:membrane associated rhomboid family serine protease/AraC-like DNA-binding protein